MLPEYEPRTRVMLRKEQSATVAAALCKTGVFPAQVERQTAKVIFFDLKMDPANNQTHKTPRFTKLSSHSFKSVTLCDWWLVRAEGKGLAIGGIASRESQEVRSFCSAAIAKRHNTTTLETADGITITLSNLINRSRTNQNGFPSQVCNRFLHGFPFYWEEYADQCCGQECPNRGSPFGAANISQPIVSLDDIPATRLRDLLISPRGHADSGAPQSQILDVLRQCGCSSDRDKTPSNHQSKATPGRKFRAAVKRPLSRGVVTRSMAKLQNLGSLQNQDSAEFSTQIEGMVTVNGSQGSHAATFSYNDKELPKSPGNAAVRRSSRLKNQAK